MPPLNTREFLVATVIFRVALSIEPNAMHFSGDSTTPNTYTVADNSLLLDLPGYRFGGSLMLH